MAAKLLTRRIDHLRIAFAVELSSDARAYLSERARLAREEGKAGIELGALIGELAPSPAPGRYAIRNSARAYQVRVREDAPGGWTVEIQIDGTAWLEEPGWDAHMQQCDAIARALGKLDDGGPTRGARVRRVDLNADFEEFEIEGLSRTHFVLPKGAGSALGCYTPEWIDTRRHVDDAPAVRSFSTSHEHTGHTVCDGNPVRAAIYNKTRELEMPSRAHKAELEKARWTAAGWKGGKVTRVEFTVRSEAMDECDLRDPRRLFSSLDALWQYLTRAWLRMIEPETASRRWRCKTDPSWVEVQATRWVSAAERLMRRRVRGGASIAQAAGTMLSVLAAAAKLPRLRFDMEGAAQESALGFAIGWKEVEDADGVVHEVPAPDEIRSWVTRYCVDVSMTFAMHMAEQLMSNEETTLAAVRTLATKHVATFCRFAQGPPQPDDVIGYWNVEPLAGELGYTLRPRQTYPGRPLPPPSVEIGS